MFQNGLQARRLVFQSFHGIGEQTGESRFSVNNDFIFAVLKQA